MREQGSEGAGENEGTRTCKGMIRSCKLESREIQKNEEKSGKKRGT